MKTKLTLLCIFSTAIAVLSSSCVTHRTVTKDGKTVRSGYVVKKPFEKTGD
ncbi:MAG: hypothetical protein ACRDBP_00430 [Luteolibacter sp.]